nr:MAG TPA: hypothetical protein [Caudoviricetes sp.]
MGIKILRQTISSTSTEPLPPPHHRIWNNCV